jgi:MYXO-CTERM domain-containing protein
MEGIGIPGGFWDKRPGGMYPPAIQTLGKLDSGTAASDSGVYWDNRVDTQTPLAGYIGATTPNYFDVKKSQASDAADLININDPSPFGYLMYYGVLSDNVNYDSDNEFGDFGNLSQGIYRDDDGDPATEGDLIAWWDGDEYRWGIDGAVFDGSDNSEDKFAPVDITLLKEWALYPLRDEANTDLYPDGGFPPGPLYELGLMDDLAGFNIDYWVYLGKDFDSSVDTGKRSFTIRLTAVSTTAAGIVPDDYGNETQPWVSDEADPLSTFINADGVINITEPAYAGYPLNIVLGDDDAAPAGVMPTVVVTNIDTGETENVTLRRDTDPDLDWRFDVSLPTSVVVSTGANNDGNLNVWPGQTVTVTYVDAFIGGDPNNPANSNVTKTDSVVILSPPDAEETPPPGDDSSSGCSCSTSPDGSVDPILPAAVLIALGYLGLRRRKSSSK